MDTNRQSPQVRTLQATFTSWTGRHLRVTEGDKDGPLIYSADLKMRKPHMIFQAEGTARLPGTVVFHNFQRKIDIAIDGQQIPLRLKSYVKNEGVFESPSLGGAVLTWKNPSHWKPMNLDCRDANGELVAQFVPSSSWSMTQAGRVELYGPSAGGGAPMDEVVVTGLALAYYVLIKTSAANAAAAGASA